MTLIKEMSVQLITDYRTSEVFRIQLQASIDNNDLGNDLENSELDTKRLQRNVKWLNQIIGTNELDAMNVYAT